MEHIVEQAYAEDPSGQWTLEQARAQPLQAFDGLLTKGYGEGVLWVRLRVAPGANGAGAVYPLYLRMRPNFLDDLRVYDEANGFVPHPTVGDRHPFEAQDVPSLAYVVRLAPSPKVRDVWVRLQTTSTRFVHFEVLDSSALSRSNLLLQTFGAAFVTLMSVFLVLGLSQSLWRRDGLSWAFAFYQAVALLHGAITLGYGRWWAEGWLPQPVVDRAFSVLVICYIFSVLLYSNFLLRELAPSRLRAVVFYTLSALLLGLVGLQFLGHIGLSLTINRLVVMVIPLLFLLDAIRQPHTPVDRTQAIGISKRPVVVYFALTAVFAYMSALPTMGLVQAYEATIYAGSFYSLSAGVLMFGMLQYRANVLLRQREALLHEARMANQRAEVEHAQRLERERMIAMLGHELKTPLATLRMMLGDKAIPSQTARQLNEPLYEINEVIERTVQSGQLESQAVGLRPVRCKLLATLQHAPQSLPEHHRVQWQASDTGVDQEIEADPFFLGVVVRNLLDNALKYSPDGAAVQARVSVLPAPSRWRLEVVNPVGRAGFPDAARVFEKFWRSPLASYRSGSGQGLFIALRLSQLMGGDLQYSHTDTAVCFVLELPMNAPSSAQTP